MKIYGNIQIPGDKSIAHRALIIASFCKGISILNNMPQSLDVKSTINCLRQCGIKIEIEKDGVVIIRGRRWMTPSSPLNCGNSGTTIRLMTGALVGKNIKAILVGDRSLSQRPMDRIINPLKIMGVEIKSNNGNAPLEISKIRLNKIEHTITVPSAQVKSSLILASLGVRDLCKISEQIKTRDHLELMIESITGINIVSSKNKIVMNKDLLKKMNGFRYNLPGDISCASFLISLAVLCNHSKLIINNILLNKRRMGFINTLINMGANIQISNNKVEFGERVGRITVLGGKSLIPCIVTEEKIVDMIDELPILSLVCAHTNGQSILHGLSELAIKESNRFTGIIKILLDMGVKVEGRGESIIIDGKKRLYNTNKLSYNDDHRLSMMICIAKLLSNETPTFPSSIDVSFPLFESIVKDIIE